MKRQLRHGMLLAVAASLFALTGCDSGDTYYDFGYPRTTNNDGNGANNDDSRLYELANTLRGHWNGAMRYEYTDDNGKRSIAQFDAQMEFDQYDATRLEGRGQEIDAATVNGKTQTQTLTFTWTIDEKTSDIYVVYDNSQKKYRITFLQNNELQSYLDGKRFAGTMIGVNNNEFIDFELSRYSYAKPASVVFSRAANTRAAGLEVEYKLVKR